jgi:hemolysin III
MGNTHELMERKQTLGEEIANCVTHGIGLIAALIASPFLIITSIQSGSISAIIGASVFSATMVLVYFTSTLYHSLPAGKVKRRVRIIDHSAIFLLIAGTYTPFTLGVLSGNWGTILLISEWLLAAVGITLHARSGIRHRKIETFLYLLMGWLILIAIKPLLIIMPIAGLILLFAGGCSYTIGIPFYTARHTRYSHFIWHLFVLCGTVCHYIAVMHYSN